MPHHLVMPEGTPLLCLFQVVYGAGLVAPLCPVVVAPACVGDGGEEGVAVRGEIDGQEAECVRVEFPCVVEAVAEQCAQMFLA